MYLDRYPSLEDFLEGRLLMCKKMHKIKDGIKKLQTDAISETIIEEKLLEKELRRSQRIQDEQNKSFELDLKRFNQTSNETFDSFDCSIIDGGISNKLLNFHKESNNGIYSTYSLKINKGITFDNPYLLFKMQLSNLDSDTMSYFLNLAISMTCGKNIYSLHLISTNIFIAKMCDKNITENIHEGSFCTKIPFMLFHNILYEEASKQDDIKISIFGLDYEPHKIEIPLLGFDRYYDSGHKRISKARPMKDQVSKSIFMDSDEYHTSSSTFSMKILPRTKLLIIRFIAKHNKNNHELLSLQPNITEVHMIKDNTIIRSISNIMFLKIMDITLFIVPLLSDATNWKDLKTMIKSGDFDSTGLSSIEESLYDFGTVTLKLVTDLSCDKYDVIITPIKFNISYCHSFTGLNEIIYDNWV